jgi:hypothetical protein
LAIHFVRSSLVRARVCGGRGIDSISGTTKGSAISAPAALSSPISPW